MRISQIDVDHQRFDLLVIGGGINGAGIARDAAMRGLRVLLLDKGDIASGTTSWSTRLIHGGLRYLEHGEIGHVRESLREREHLLRIAPHLVKPLALMIPIYEQNRRGRMAIRAGMVAYDLLSFDKSLPRHRMLSRAEAIEQAPGLNRTGLLGAAIYHDAQVEFAERLVLESILSAIEHGARVSTYARVDEFIIENSVVRGVKFTDLLDGNSHSVRADVTINVAGPWVDDVLSRAGRSVERQIGGTKGSHIIVEKFPGAPADAMYVEAGADGRPFFIIPWNGLYLIGTTDKPYDGELDRVVASEDEIAYLLSETARVIPSSQLSRDSIRYRYSGVRPLPYVSAGDPAGITRRHYIRDHEPALSGILSVVGGKLTTYRSLSEHAVNLVLKKLRRKLVGCTTAKEVLPGARYQDPDNFERRFRAESGLPKAIANRLLRIYGSRATDVLSLAKENAALLEPFDRESGAIGAEIVFAFRSELAENITDCLMRRTMTGWNKTLGLDSVEAAVAVAQKSLGWDSERAIREISEHRKYVARFHTGVS